MFAEAIPDVNGFLNLGALGLLGYFLIFGLPKLITSINETQLKFAEMLAQIAQADRASFETRAARISASIDDLRKDSRCRASDDSA